MFNLGSTNLGIRLVARLLSGPAAGVWIGTASWYSEYDSVYVVDNNPFYGPIWGLLEPGMGPGFPWGNDVLPDQL